MGARCRVGRTRRLSSDLSWLAPQVATAVQWIKAEGSHGVPLWIIILAILIGLLLLGLLIYILYKVSHILLDLAFSHQVLPLTQHTP